MTRCADVRDCKPRNPEELAIKAEAALAVLGCRTPATIRSPRLGNFTQQGQLFAVTRIGPRKSPRGERSARDCCLRPVEIPLLSALVASDRRPSNCSNSAMGVSRAEFRRLERTVFGGWFRSPPRYGDSRHRYQARPHSSAVDSMPHIIRPGTYAMIMSARRDLRVYDGKFSRRRWSGKRGSVQAESDYVDPNF